MVRCLVLPHLSMEPMAAFLELTGIRNWIGLMKHLLSVCVRMGKRTTWRRKIPVTETGLGMDVRVCTHCSVA